MDDAGAGTILKGIGGLYTVFSEGNVYECRLRGSIRLEGISPVTGDRVRLENDANTGIPSVISSVMKRRNVLVRPKVANIDKIVLVIASLSPAPDLLLVDKLLVAARAEGIEPVLVINKADQDEETAAEIAGQYKNAVRCFITKAGDANENGLEQLTEALDGCTSVLAGQSGVGKSTILNFLTDGAFMATGDISEKSLRGRHTTRHAELFPVSSRYVKAPSFIIDSPGFSLLELRDIPARDLSGYYPEVYAHRDVCRFQDCSHTGEPGCFVPGLVSSGIFNKFRYDRYVSLYKELENREKNRYKTGGIKK